MSFQFLLFLFDLRVGCVPLHQGVPVQVVLDRHDAAPSERLACRDVVAQGVCIPRVLLEDLHSLRDVSVLNAFIFRKMSLKIFHLL